MPISNVPEEFTKGFDLLAWANDYKSASVASERTVGDWQWALVEEYFADKRMPEIVQSGEGPWSSVYKVNGQEMTGYELSDYVRMQSNAARRKTADAFLTWFETFLDEKNLPYEQWEITGPDGTPHMINSEVVIEQIKDAPPHEQAGIKDKIVQIDFANGDVNDYFKHLAEALVQNYGPAF